MTSLAFIKWQWVPIERFYLVSPDDHKMFLWENVTHKKTLSLLSKTQGTVCHECQPFLSSVPALLSCTLLSLSRSHIIAVFLCQVCVSLKSLSAHRAPVRGVMAEWLEALLCFNTVKMPLWKCSRLLPTQEDLRAGEILVFCFWGWPKTWVCSRGQSLLAASCRSHWPRLAQWPADGPVCPSCGKNKQQQQITTK